MNRGTEVAMIVPPTGVQAVRGHPWENPGRQPKNLVSSDSIPSLKREKIIIIIIMASVLELQSMCPQDAWTPTSQCVHICPEQDDKLLPCTTFDEGEGSLQGQGRREPSGGVHMSWSRR